MLYTYSEIENDFKKRKINRTTTPLIDIKNLIENPLRWEDEPNYIYIYLDTRKKIPKI